MKTHVLTGSKQEIAENLVRIAGEVREAIVFEETSGSTISPAISEMNDVFADMRPFMVDVQQIDDSREAIYTRLDGE